MRLHSLQNRLDFYRIWTIMQLRNKLQRTRRFWIYVNTIHQWSRIQHVTYEQRPFVIFSLYETLDLVLSIYRYIFQQLSFYVILTLYCTVYQLTQVSFFPRCFVPKTTSHSCGSSTNCLLKFMPPSHRLPVTSQLKYLSSVR